MLMGITRHSAIPVLLAAVSAGGGCRAPRGGTATSGSVTVTHAVISAPPADAEATAFLVIENHGSAAVTLLGASSPDADSIQMHRVIGGQMEPALEVPVAAGSDVRFVPGGYHLMLAGLRRPLAIGDTLSLELHFAPGGAVTVRAPVLNYTDAVSDLPSR
jgi:copper(I)-binding protein